jgi:phosphomannomutase/phosphoglucomutase
MGFTVIDIGICPTPVFYFSLFKSRAHSGFIITASHNPQEYNGFKICYQRQSVWGDELQNIRMLYEKKEFAPPSYLRGGLEIVDMNSAYITWIVSHFDHLKNISPACAIDCGNGTAGVIIPHLVAHMGWNNITVMYPEIDGTFPHHEADPTVMNNMQDLASMVATNRCELGIGFDGDCDRMGALDHRGNLIAGDILLGLFAHALLEQKPGAGIVCDIKSSQAVIDSLTSKSAHVYIAPAGHSRIKNALIRHKALLAGELSCHFFFNDRYFGYEDGLYAMMRLIEIIIDRKSTLYELLKPLPTKVASHEIRLSCQEEQKAIIINHVEKYFAAQSCLKMITIDGVRVHMQSGWGLARYSNTQPVISLRFEADTEEDLRHVKRTFAGALEKYFDFTLLQSQIGF